MKNLQSKSLASLLLISIFTFTFCSKEAVEVPTISETTKYQIDENYRLANLTNSLQIHNQVMDEIFGEEIEYTNDNEYVSAIIQSVEDKTRTYFNEEQKVFMHDMFNTYLKLDTKSMISKFETDGMISKKAAEVFNQIDDYMLSKELETYREIAFEIENVQKRFIDENAELSDFDKHQLTSFLLIVDNSAEHYKESYEGVDLTNSRESCGKCLKRNLWQILLGDGVGGAVLGITGCLVFPPACPAIIPTLLVIGSGGVAALRCPQCF